MSDSHYWLLVGQICRVLEKGDMKEVERDWQEEGQ